jgi:hypothetical protein
LATDATMACMFEAPYDDAGPTLSSTSWGTVVRLTFAEPRRPPEDDDMVEYLVKVEGDGLRVESPVLSLAGGDGLPTFLEDLASHFRGWSGARTWRSLEDQLRLEATWADGGHVNLRFRITPSIYETWEVAVSFTVEAGAEMEALASEMARFFSL